MAQKVNIVLVDDLDASEASETVSFALDGTSYEVDLNDQHADELRGALAVYVGHGRRVSGRKTSSPSRRSSAGAASGPSAREIRDWARSTNRSVPERGRIPADLREAFDAAN